MTAAQTYAWILLSLSTGGRSLQEIVGAADMINHAVPTPDELCLSLGWLRERGLAERGSAGFALTKRGSALVERIWNDAGTLGPAWDAAVAALAPMVGATPTPEALSEGEVREAYGRYSPESERSNDEGGETA